MKLSTPTNTPAWGKALIESLTTVVSDIGSKIDLINSNINSKFDELSAQLLTDVKRASDTANDAINMACKNETSIALLRSDHEKLLLRCINVENENIKLRRKCESQENYSRRDNLIIKGVTEENNEDMSTCKRLVRNIFIQKLNLSEIEVNSINFVRCHRIGKTTLPNGAVNRKRPIIVRFHSYNDRRVVWSARSALTNESISINENFAAEVEYRRRLLYPILKAAKQSNRFEGKAFINGDTLVLNSQSYSVEDLHKLPHDLHPSNLSKKENDQWLIFGGILSQYNCLSNFYKSKLIHDDTEFDTIEAAYQYTKATRFHDKACANNVILAQSPSEAKSLGSNVKGFKKSVWDSEKEDVMLDLLRAKFYPNSPLAAELIATSGKSLAEAGKSPIFSTGLQLHHKDIFDTKKWKKNMLCQALMKVRNELVSSL